MINKKELPVINKVFNETTSREEEIINKVISILVEKLNPKKILLFGSRAKGIQYPQADFDIAVDCQKPDKIEIKMVKAMIDVIAGLYHVDLIFLHNVDTEFQEIILETGIILYEKGK